MAPQPCTECGKEIGTDAKTCPWCGKSNPTVAPIRLNLLLLLVLVIVLLLLIAFHQSSTSDHETADLERLPPPTQTCGAVEPSLLRDLNLNAAAPWKATVSQSPPGLIVTNRGTVWFVSSPEGATWVTNFDPAISIGARLVLPLNAKARTKSDIGIDIEFGSPSYGGLDDNDPGATRSRDCAASLSLQR